MTSEPLDLFGGCAYIGGSMIDYGPATTENPKLGLSPVMGPNFPFGRWVIFGGHKAGDYFVAVLIGRDGQLLSDSSGPENDDDEWIDVDSPIGQQSIEVQKRATYKFSPELSKQEARQLAGEAYFSAHQRAQEAAQLANLSTHDVLQNMPEAFLFRLEQYSLRDAITGRIFSLTGITAETLAQLKHGRRNYFVVDGFATAARIVADEYQELGFLSNAPDTPGAVWELVTSNGQEAPKLHDRETAQQAASWLSQTRQKYGVTSNYAANETTSFAYGFGGMDEILIGKSELTNRSQNAAGDESKHPRKTEGRDAGQFTLRGADSSGPPDAPCPCDRLDHQAGNLTER